MTRVQPDLYDARFSEREISAKDGVWREIVRYIDRWIDPAHPVLDVACDQGHFIRWVTASERWATDIRDVSQDLPPNVRFVCASGLGLASRVPTNYFGSVFMSNYLEHLESGDAVIEQLRVAAQLLRPGGRLIVLQPNIRLVGPRYWDFIDHRVALTERSLLEAAELAGFRTEELITRFLPYSTKGRLPTAPTLVKAYLHFRPAWLVLGPTDPVCGDAAMTEARGARAAELAIVLPVYNEGEAVEPVLRALSVGVTTSHELVVVYDFDGDTTVPVVERLSEEIAGLRALRNDLGRGVLNAMKAGITGTTAPYVLISMADGSDEPTVVDQMVSRARDGADIVAASRYMRGGRQIGGPPFKRLLSRVAGLTLHWFAGVPTHDPTNNFKLYRRSFLEVTPIESTAGFELALELTVKATLAGRRIAEVPTTWRDRTSGQSNFKLRKWLPHYLHWYRVAFAGRWFGRGRTAAMSRRR